MAPRPPLKARTLAVTRGAKHLAADDPGIWFTSAEFCAKVLSAGSREWLSLMDVQAGVAFPLPARTFIFKAEPMREKGALAAGAVLADELRFNHAVTYSESTYRWAFQGAGTCR
jgi:hypothetical protein